MDDLSENNNNTKEEGTETFAVGDVLTFTCDEPAHGGVGFHKNHRGKHCVVASTLESMVYVLTNNGSGLINHDEVEKATDIAHQERQNLIQLAMLATIGNMKICDIAEKLSSFSRLGGLGGFGGIGSATILRI